MNLIVMITAAQEKGLTVADNWEKAGAPGVTLMRGYGLNTLQQAVHHGQIELPRMLVSMASALMGVLEQADEDVLIFLCACEDTQVDGLIDLASRTLGDLTQPGHGVLFVLPIERALGVIRR